MTDLSATPPVPSAQRRETIGAVAALLFAVVAGALVTYKASSALKAISRARQAHTLAPKAEMFARAGLPSWARPVAGTANYFLWVMVALGFGIVLGALVRALFPDRWLARTVGAGGRRGLFLAAAAGTPLMLCSCCVAPLFDGVYARTRRLGPSLAMMLAAPALNPAALVLTFLLFPLRLAGWRIGLSIVLVLGVSAGVGALARDTAAPLACLVGANDRAAGGIARAIGRALREIAGRSLPAILLGVVLSAMLMEVVPLSSLGATHGGWALLTLAVAAIAVPLAMPTFGEIPIALGLLAAGAPQGAALAMLIAGPAINLPSLLTLRRAVSTRAAVALAAAVFLVAGAGGLMVGR